MPRTTRYSRFGASVKEALVERQISQAELAVALGRSPAYLNQTMTGTKPASAQWADLIADVLKLSPAKRVELHAAAARDHGFKLDLTPPDRKGSARKE
jgi:transcriptional regulator with XRE-family HTH domain